MARSRSRRTRTGRTCRIRRCNRGNGKRRNRRPWRRSASWRRGSRPTSRSSPSSRRSPRGSRTLRTHIRRTSRKHRCNRGNGTSCSRTSPSRRRRNRRTRTRRYFPHFLQPAGRESTIASWKILSELQVKKTSDFVALRPKFDYFRQMQSRERSAAPAGAQARRFLASFAATRGVAARSRVGSRTASVVGGVTASPSVARVGGTVGDLPTQQQVPRSTVDAVCRRLQQERLERASSAVLRQQLRCCSRTRDAQPQGCNAAKTGCTAAAQSARIAKSVR